MENNTLAKTPSTQKLFLYLSVALISLFTVYVKVIDISFELVDFFMQDHVTKWNLTKKTRKNLSLLITLLPFMCLFFTCAQQYISKYKELLGNKLFNWLIYISFTIFVFIVVADVYFLNYLFLSGELSKIGLIKIFIVIVSVILSVNYLIILLQNNNFFIRKVVVGLSVLLIMGVIIINISFIPSRAQMMKMRSDMDKIDNINDIINAISQHHQLKNQLPDNLDIIMRAKYFSKEKMQEITKAHILYKLIEQQSFEICTNFNFPLAEIQANRYYTKYKYSLSEHHHNCMIFNIESLKQSSRMY